MRARAADHAADIAGLVVRARAAHPEFTVDEDEVAFAGHLTGCATVTGSPGNDLFDEHDAPPDCTVRLPQDVEPKIDLVEVYVPRNRQLHDSGLDETKPNQTDKCSPIPRVELCTARNRRSE